MQYEDILISGWQDDIIYHRNLASVLHGIAAFLILLGVSVGVGLAIYVKLSPGPVTFLPSLVVALGCGFLGFFCLIKGSMSASTARRLEIDIAFRRVQLARRRLYK